MSRVHIKNIFITEHSVAVMDISHKSWVAFLQGFLPINPSLVTVIKTEEEKKAICYKLSLAKLIGHHKVRRGPHSDTPKYAFITHGPPLLGIHADKPFLAALHFY